MRKECAVGELSETAARAVEAYGGVSRWRQAQWVNASVSVRGLAFVLKQRPFFRRAALRVAVPHCWSRLQPIGRRPHIAGVLDGPDVYLEDQQGQRVAARARARTAFPSLRRHFRWDDLDMAYFANYAFWNYLSLPALLLSDAVQWQETAPGVLDARFPDHIPTHCRSQRFHFDQHTGLLRQHDYTADIIGGFARAAHVIEAHTTQGGLCFPSRRRVTPRAPSGRPLAGPTLIAIEIHALSVETA